MQQLTLEKPRSIRHCWKQLIKNFRRLLIACMFIEKCRFCGKEIAIAVEAQPGSLSDAKIREKEREEIEESGQAQDSSTAPLRRYSRIFENYATSARKAKPESIGAEQLQGTAPNAVQTFLQNAQKHLTFMTWLLPLQEPFELLQNEVLSLMQATTHAQLVIPALIYFDKHPGITPRLSECLCHECWTEIEFDTPELTFFHIDHQNQKELPMASGVNYGGKIKELIRAFKYDGDRTLSTDLASVMQLGMNSLSEHMPASSALLVPVPLHRSREMTRGFNQAELLAREISKVTSIPLASKALQRARSTRPQQLLAREDRLKNVNEAFVGNKHLIKGKTVILIDDVCTSGSTLTSCAEEVLKCGALSVVALTVAKAILAHDT